VHLQIWAAAFEREVASPFDHLGSLRYDVCPLRDGSRERTFTLKRKAAAGHFAGLTFALMKICPTASMRLLNTTARLAAVVAVEHQRIAGTVRIPGPIVIARDQPPVSGIAP
jgi:hypothetical protein